MPSRFALHSSVCLGASHLVILTYLVGLLGSQVLAMLTWRDFGWRLHSRLGVDFRHRGAKERGRVYSAQAVFVTLIKFDVMWEVRARPASPRLKGKAVLFPADKPLWSLSRFF